MAIGCVLPEQFPGYKRTAGRFRGGLKFNRLGLGRLAVMNEQQIAQASRLKEVEAHPAHLAALRMNTEGT